MKFSKSASDAWLPQASVAVLRRQFSPVRLGRAKRARQDSLACLERQKIARRLLLLIAALNLAGIACFALATQAQGSLASEAAEAVADPASALDTIGFGLMLPGIFFASIALLGAKVFAWNEQLAFGVWYATGFALNLVAAWRAGEIFAGAREE